MNRPLLIAALTFALGSLGTATASGAEKVRRNVEVEWEAVEGATLYEVQVIRQDVEGKKPQRFKTKEPHWSATINPGPYTMQIRSFDDRGAPGDWSPPSALLVKLPSVVQESPKADEIVNASEEKTHDIRLRWNSVPGAEKYKVSVHSTTSAWKEEKELTETSYKPNVPVGENFAWNVYAIDAKGENGDLNATDINFQVKGPRLKKPEIQKPLSKYVSEVKWEAPAYAKNFSYELSYRDPETRKWRKLDSKNEFTDNTLKLDISRPSGKYRLKVQAFADRRESSKTAQLDFETRGGFRDPAALEAAIMRDSITKPTNYYAITSYLLTQIQYVGLNYDRNTAANFDAVGGTGRVGLGYQNPESNWGGFGIVDLSGFTIQGKNFQFSSIEAHATRKLEFGQGGLFLIGMGVFSKELPVVLGSAVDGFSGIGKVRNTGPHVGFSYWFPLTQRFGAQVNARSYYTLMGSSPTGGKVESTLSYQYGLLGTYRLSSDWMGYAGYAYRKDEARYQTSSGGQSFAQPGQVNSISIQGHYLNLLLEYSF